jgi:hypothetical protein
VITNGWPASAFWQNSYWTGVMRPIFLCCYTLMSVSFTIIDEKLHLGTFRLLMLKTKKNEEVI